MSEEEKEKKEEIEQVVDQREYNPVSVIYITFKKGETLTYVNEQADYLIAHYMNGLAMQHISHIPVPIPLQIERKLDTKVN
jgi:hypothetical protein